MTPGHLSILTNDRHPGLIRVLLDVDPPATEPAPGSPLRIRYVARFNDSDAALMHTHEILKRRLVDLDTHLYRASVEFAIAAVASLRLGHREVFLDNGLPAQIRAAIPGLTRSLQDRHRRKERLFETLGYIGIGLLLLNLLGLLSWR